jgi:hypothetical protein
LDRQNEEAQEDDERGDEENSDLDCVFEERDIAEKLRERVEQRASGVDPDLGDAAGPQKVGGGKPGTDGLEPKLGKAFEDDTGEVVPVADEISEDTDKEWFSSQGGQ